MNIDEWLKFGFEQGFCGPAVCETHDGLPMSEAEYVAFETNDPCIHVVRLYESAEMKAAVEEGHSPSVWRAI